MKRGNGLFTVLVMALAVCTLIMGVILIVSIKDVNALSKQSAAYPGQSLAVQYSTTSPIQIGGVFAVEVTSTGVGTISIQRSEDGTNYNTVKTLTNASSTEQRKYLYETFGDTDRSAGAWYRAYLTTLTSGSYRVRFVK